MSEAREAGGRALEHVPGPLRRVADNAARHHTLTLAAGLAFFGLLSIGPALGVGFGLLRLVASPEAADQLVDTLQDTFSEQLGLGELLEQMEDLAARYAGIGLLVLLWPATTLASGWTRALDAVAEVDSGGGLRGLRGRVRGLLPGAILVAGLFMLLSAVTFGAALAGEGWWIVVVVGGAVLLQVALNLVIYRFLPSEALPLAALWPGAVLATVGVVAATAALGLALTAGEGLADHYPPTLTTAIVLGLWLYAANVVLLLGAEVNQARHGRAADG